MIRRLAIAFAAALMAVFLCAPAAAQNICAARDDVVQRLWDRWQEAQVALAVINDGKLLEIFVSERGSWTVIEEENYLTLRNNKTDKVYKLVMEEIE